MFLPKKVLKREFLMSSEAKKEPNSFVFAIIMCLVCGLLLTAAAVGLKSRQTQNVIVDQQKNILKALGLLPQKKLKNNEVQQLFNQAVSKRYMTADGNILMENQQNTQELYIIESATGIEKYAIPFKAYGLWSWIYGYLAMQGDGQTIAGFTVYAHGETPGLGGECEKPWFQNQFVGKKIVDLSGKFTSIGVVKGKVQDSIPAQEQYRYVDGMSGATITGKGIEKHLKIELEKYEPLSKKLRLNQHKGKG